MGGASAAYCSINLLGRNLFFSARHWWYERRASSFFLFIFFFFSLTSDGGAVEVVLVLASGIFKLLHVKTSPSYAWGGESTLPSVSPSLPSIGGGKCLQRPEAHWGSWALPCSPLRSLFPFLSELWIILDRKQLSCFSRRCLCYSNNCLDLQKYLFGITSMGGAGHKHEFLNKAHWAEMEHAGHCVTV